MLSYKIPFKITLGQRVTTNYGECQTITTVVNKKSTSKGLEERYKGKNIFYVQ